MEHYDDQNRLHCYEENSQGPCKDGEILVQPDEVDENGALKNPVCSPDFELRRPGVLSGNGFRTKCKNGKRFDKTTKTCKKTSKHGKSTKRRSIGGQKNVVNFLRHKKKRQGRR